MYKTISLVALFALLVGGALPHTAFAKGGSTAPVTCATDIRDLKLTSGGNKGGHTLIPDSMHITASFTYVSCAPWGIVTTVFYDHVTGDGIATSTSNMSAYGISTPMSALVANLQFSHQYDVVITTNDYFTGAQGSQTRASIVTQSKL